MESLPEIGDVLDDTYELVGLLGRGGFGAVYRARQLHMDRDVALKLLIAGGPKFDEMVQRFRREVMAIRNLTHPNTIRIYDFRDNPEGQLYYTMEALEGVTLEEELEEKGPFAPRRLKPILHQVAKSLAEAHSYNIIHRDLKPSNIMLVDMHGETDFVKVLDFGIAKMLEAEGEDGDLEELTSAGMLVGTIRYMAPEQIAEDDLGPHTDLYTLGLIAVEMLTGNSVFSGTGRWEVLQEQISDEPIEIPPLVLSSGLGPVIARCLHKDPSGRFSRAEEAIEMLEGIETSMLRDQSLYVEDASGEYVPAEARPGPDDTLERDSPVDLPPGAISDFEGEKTEVTSPPPEAGVQTPGAGDSLDKTTIDPTPPGQIPDPSGPTGRTNEIDAVPGPTDQMDPVSGSGYAEEDAGGDDLQPTYEMDNPGGVGGTREMDESELPDQIAANPPAEPRSGRVDDTGPAFDGAEPESSETGPQPLELSSSKSSSGSNKKKIAFAAAALVILACVGVTAWQLSDSGDAGENSTPSTPANSGGDPTAESTESANEAESEETQPSDGQTDSQPDTGTRELVVEVREPPEQAEVLVDGDLRGTTPHTLVFDETASRMRVEADGYEPVEVELDSNAEEFPSEVTLELEPVDDDPETVSARDSGPGAGAREGAGSGSSGSGTSSPGVGQGARDSTPSETGASDDDPPEPDDSGGGTSSGGQGGGGGWVNVDTDSDQDSQTEPEEEPSGGGGSGWVDVESDDEEEPTETEESDDGEDGDDEVPLF